LVPNPPFPQNVTMDSWECVNTTIGDSIPLMKGHGRNLVGIIVGSIFGGIIGLMVLFCLLVGLCLCCCPVEDETKTKYRSLADSDEWLPPDGGWRVGCQGVVKFHRYLFTKVMIVWSRTGNWEKLISSPRHFSPSYLCLNRPFSQNPKFSLKISRSVCLWRGKA
jgi:hypothetical protein